MRFATLAKQAWLSALVHNYRMESVAAQRLSVASSTDDAASCLRDRRPDGRRRRNRALAAQRRNTAIQMITQGHTYEHVANALGYANRGTVHHIVQGALSSHEAKSVEDMRAKQGARLDSLLAAVWERAMTGDVQAINAAAKLVHAQCQLLGLVDKKSTKSREKRAKTVVLSSEDLEEMGFALH